MQSRQCDVATCCRQMIASPHHPPPIGVLIHTVHKGKRRSLLPVITPSICPLLTATLEESITGKHSATKVEAALRTHLYSLIPMCSRSRSQGLGSRCGHLCCCCCRLRLVSCRLRMAVLLRLANHLLLLCHCHRLVHRCVLLLVIHHAMRYWHAGCARCGSVMGRVWRNPCRRWRWRWQCQSSCWYHILARCTWEVESYALMAKAEVHPRRAHRLRAIRPPQTRPTGA